jgi:hypothetical protein
MKPVLVAGVITVQLALISYSIAILTEQWKKVITARVLVFLTMGVLLDVTATACMIAGSRNPWYSLHGILGYSSLAGMLTDAILIWRTRTRHGMNCPVPQALHLYSRFAYIWWILAYITGALLVSVLKGA